MTTISFTNPDGGIIRMDISPELEKAFKQADMQGQLSAHFTSMVAKFQVDCMLALYMDLKLLAQGQISADTMEEIGKNLLIGKLHQLLDDFAEREIPGIANKKLS